MKGVVNRYDCWNDHDSIELVNLFQRVYLLKCDNNQDIMVAVETNKQVYMFYQAPYHYNTDYQEALN